MLWREYTGHRATIQELSSRYHRSVNWIRKELRAVELQQQKPEACSCIIVADCVFFKRSFGMLVLRDPHLRRNLYCQKIQTETIAEYYKARLAVEDAGVRIVAAVIDGRPGVREIFRDVPVQMCHFHQKAIINRYLTRRPKLDAGKELRSIVMNLCQTTESSFSEALNRWHERWQGFLKERTINTETGRWHYTHKKLRAAHRSLKTNLPSLFTYQMHPELNIPNTTNSLDGLFAHLKDLLRVHRGIKKDLKEKIIADIFQN